MPISKKLPLTFITLITLPMLLLSLIIYFSISSSLEKVSRDRLIKISDLNSNGITSLVETQKKLAQFLAETDEISSVFSEFMKSDYILSSSDAFKKSSDLIKKICDSSPGVEDISCADAKGQIFLSLHAGIGTLNISDRDYFKITQKGNIAVSDMLISKTDLAKVIVISVPKFDSNNAFIGAISIKIDMRYFEKYFKNISIDKTGYAFLLDSEGKVIYDKSINKIGKPTDNTQLKSIILKNKDSNHPQSGFFNMNISTSTYFFSYKIIPELNWILVVTQNEAEIHSPIVIALRIILCTAAIILIITILLTINFSKSITIPIENLNNTMKKATNGDLQAICDYESKNEFGQLSSSFNIMIKKLSSSYEELNSLYEELAATEEELRTQFGELQQNEEKMINMAYFDHLTGLPNKILFMDKLGKEISVSIQNHTYGAVYFLDLDNFKNINDTLGHDFGDILLTEVAKKFSELISDSEIACRFGGDEFIFMKPSVLNINKIYSFANKLLKIFNDNFIIDDKKIYITASIGISIFPKDGTDCNSILRNADTAMYKAKDNGKNNYCYYDLEMFHALNHKSKINSLLRWALDNNKFQLYYQPQFDIKSKKIIGFEALIRLYTKETGFIPPNIFIPIAEETDLITEIGKWCFKTACLQNKEWKSKGYNYNRIAVNISSVQFQQKEFMQILKEILKETDINPEYVEIEITETVLMKSLEKNSILLNNVRELGIKIALDDFGTGYSSLNYLKNIPINILKIDKSFIDGICLGGKEEAITHSIIEMAHKLDLEVVAEGVETVEQLAMLNEKGCDIIQGYLFSKPIPADLAEEMLKNN